MKVLVSGSTGLVGAALLPELCERNHEVVRLVRRPANENEIEWDPATGVREPSRLAGVDAACDNCAFRFVKLGGDGVAQRIAEARR